MLTSKANQNYQNRTTKPITLQKIKDIISLSKLIISASISFTTLTGYVLSKGAIDLNVIPTLIGVFLLAAGASAINHIIERKTDALMPRTQNRPIPSGRITVAEATIWASMFLIAGATLLLLYTNPACVILGLFNALWYNLVYTPLKRVSTIALFAGTITGIIPFFMGTVAATNQLPLHSHYFIAMYMFLWQIPHFLLLLCKYGVEYEKAGLASITKSTSVEKVLIISYIWMIASSIASLSIPVFGISKHFVTSLSILAISFAVIVYIIYNLFISKKTQDYKTAFIITNLMQSGFMVALIIDSLI